MVQRGPKQTEVEEGLIRAPKPGGVPPPRGIFAAKVDDKGRMKLPAKFQEWLGDHPLFVTTLDKRIARIYTTAVWDANEQVLSGHRSNPAVAADVSFWANLYGADAEIDNQGRITVPTELRRLLEMENQTVWLLYFNDGIDIYNKAEYDRRSGRASENLEEKVEFLRQNGLK